MGVDRASLSGLDPEGFADVERLRVFARRAEHEFVHMYPAAALLVESTTPAAARAEAAARDDRERSFARTQTERSYARTHHGSEEPDVHEAHPSEVARYVGRVAFLTKRPGNPFPDMITVGRAMNNDITLLIGSVSKVHGYFREEQGAWSFIDQRATNGTCLDERRLEPGERVALRDGSRLQFGPDLACTFLLPHSLARRLSAGPGP